MRNTFVVGLVLILGLAGGAVSSIAYVASAPAPPAGSSSQVVNNLFSFISLFSSSPFSSGSAPVSVSSPINATSSAVSLDLYASTGTLSLMFSNQSGDTYHISGTMAKNSAPPSVSLAGSVLSISLPVGALTVTLPASLSYTVKVVMDTGTLKLDTTGAPVTEVNATLGTGIVDFDMSAGTTRQASMDVSVGTLSGTVNSDAAGVQVTASSSMGGSAVHGSNLVTVSQAQGYQEVRTSNFNTASQTSIINLQVNVGTVSAEVG